MTKINKDKNCSCRPIPSKLSIEIKKINSKNLGGKNEKNEM